MAHPVPLWFVGQADAYDALPARLRCLMPEAGTPGHASASCRMRTSGATFAHNEVRMVATGQHLNEQVNTSSSGPEQWTTKMAKCLFGIADNHRTPTMQRCIKKSLNKALMTFSQQKVSASANSSSIQPGQGFRLTPPFDLLSSCVLVAVVHAAAVLGVTTGGGLLPTPGKSRRGCQCRPGCSYRRPAAPVAPTCGLFPPRRTQARPGSG